MSLSAAVSAAVKFGIVGAVAGAAAGVFKITMFGDDSEDMRGYPASLRASKNVLEHEEASLALTELSHLRYHVPDVYDDLVHNINRMLNAEQKSKENAKNMDRRAVTKWRMEAKRTSDAAIGLVRKFRAVVESDHPAALESFDQAAATISDIVTASLHNVLMDSAAMLS